LKEIQIKNSPANLQDFAQNNSHLQNLFSWEIEVLLEEFLATKKSLNTKKSYSQDLSDFFQKYEIFYVKDFIEKSLSWEIWNYIWDFLENFKKSDKNNENRILNPRTINRKLFALSSFYNFLNKKYNFKHNPTKVFTALKTWKHSSTDSLQGEEIIKILERMKENYLLSENNEEKILRLRDYLIFIFLSFSLRRDEISKLKWSDLKNSNWKNYFDVYQKWWEIKQIPVPDSIFRYLWIFRNLKKSGWIMTDFIISPTRNNRTWDLSKPLSWDMIYKLVEKNYQKFYSNENISDDKKIFFEKIKNLKTESEKFKKRIYRAKKFLSDKKNILNTKYFEKISEKKLEIKNSEKKISEISQKIKNLKEEEKMIFWAKKITPHSFRKTFVETMIQKNVNFTNIMNATGHANVQMIDYYQSLDKVENNAINEIDLDY